MWLVSSELIFPSGFLPWKVVTSRLAHRVYDGRKNSDRPHTLIFRVLRWHDRLEILKGARQAYPVRCAQDNVTLLFFPDFSPVAAAKRKSLVPVLRSMTALGLQPFLAYASILFGKRRILSAPCHRVGHLLRIHRAAGGRQPPFLWSGGRGLMVGMEEMVAGGIWMITRSLFSFFFPLSSWDNIYILFDTIVPLLVRLTPPFFLSFFFFFWRGLMESRFHYNNVLVMWTFWEARCGLKWIGHGSSQVFCCSIRPMFSVTCGLNCFLSIVVGHFCLCCFYFLQQIFMLLFTLPCF